jgi:hypothetical protein
LNDEHSKFPTEQVKMMADLGLWEWWLTLNTVGLAR